MISRTHSIEGGINGAYAVLKDTTTDSAYSAESLDISANAGGVITLINTTTGEIHVRVLSQTEVLESRSGTGLVITGEEFTPAFNPIIDGLYDSTYSIEIGEVGYASNTRELFYGIIVNKVKLSIINTVWKVVYSSKNPYYDNSLKLKSWLDNMIMANQLGYYSEALRLLNALKKVVL